MISGSIALVRGVPASFASAVTGRAPDPPLSPSRAVEQHDAYVRALADGGYLVMEMPPNDAFPDCLFIEDTAVVLGERALVTRPGHASRRGETEAVAAVLGELVPLHRAQAPATIDGGDVLVVGDRVFVGGSRRTNAPGAAAVAALAEPQGMTVSTVPVGSVLHLKSGLSALDDETVLWHPRACEREHLVGLRILEVPGDDPEAANVVRLADGRILVADGHPETRSLVEAEGFETSTVDVSEIARADGGLTCLSIRIR